MSDNFSIIAFKKSDLPGKWQSYDYTHFHNAVRMSVEKVVEEYASSPGFWALLNAVNEARHYPIDLPEDGPQLPVVPPEKHEAEDEDDLDTQQIQVNRKIFNLIVSKMKADLTTSNKVLDFLFHLALREKQGDDFSSYFEKGAAE